LLLEDLFSLILSWRDFSAFLQLVLSGESASHSLFNIRLTFKSHDSLLFVIFDFRFESTVTTEVTTNLFHQRSAINERVKVPSVKYEDLQVFNTPVIASVNPFHTR
jgi:hypothetical protein